MDEVESLLEHVADMRIENILAELKQEDSEYQSYIERINKTSSKHDEIMNGLSEENKLFVEEYWMNFFDKVSIENKHLYYSGYKDCIKLLKRLGVI